MTLTEELKVTAIMTAPRHGIVLARNYIELALKKVGVPLVVSGGVFYGQCMQRMLQDAVDSGIDVAITVDSDSLFHAVDVQTLLSHLVYYEVDALAALQCRRGKEYPLLTIKDSTQTIVGEEPFVVDTAHFGLTAVNLHKLKDVPKPWFYAQPDQHGEWSDDKIDDDIWFWKQWEKAGFSTYIDPAVRVGHLELMATGFNEDMEPETLTVDEWYDKYKPYTQRATR